jgi:hypothetical protein
VLAEAKLNNPVLKDHIVADILDKRMKCVDVIGDAYIQCPFISMHRHFDP